MKNNIIYTLIITMTFIVSCSNNNGKPSTENIHKVEGNGAQISFTETKMQLGTFSTDSVTNCVFHYSNIGDQPLVLSNVITTCGCVKSYFSEQPLMPGNNDSIVFELRIKETGNLTKAVVVKSNAINEPAVTLRMFGNVIK